MPDVRAAALTSVALAVGLAACASAPAPRPAPPPVFWGADPGDRAPGPLLFEVDAAGGKLHLFGTMHTEPLASLPRLAAERYAAAHIVAFEVDVANVNTLKVLAVAMLPLTRSLDQLIGPEAFARLANYLAGEVPPAALKRLRPWFVEALIMRKAAGMPTEAETVEVGMLKQGRAEGKSVRFLETAEQQLALLDKITDPAALAAMTRELDKIPAAMRAMADAYRAGDVPALETLIASSEGPGAASEHMRLLLGARNERWIPFLEQLGREGGAFVAVGAAHLVGKDGVVALLRARGYHVARVRPP